VPEKKERQKTNMVMVKKSNESGGAPSLDILAAKLRIVEAEYFAEPYEVNLDNGRSFEADPNVNVRAEVVKNLVEPGKDEGEKFYDRFKLKQNKNGDWVFARFSKLGNLMVVLYGQDWFGDATAGFDENDLLDFEFIAQVEPKRDNNGKPLAGSTINWKSMRPAGGKEERDAELPQSKTDPKVADEGDFEDLSF
jgi:hypothetical protein